MTRILQILPHAPTARCGVGNYGWLLARELRNRHEVDSSFLVAGATWMAPEDEPGFAVRRLVPRTSRALVHDVQGDVGSIDAVLLHLSLYGYQKRGVPFWLGRAMRGLRAWPASPALVLMVHELAASGPPHTSAFWLRPLQERILRQLARCADAIITNRGRYAAWLDAVHRPAGNPATVLPVFSNLGESPPSNDDEGRWRHMLVFASTVSAPQIPVLEALVTGLNTSQLTWIGENPPPAFPSGVTVRHVPFLPSTGADACFQEHGVAFTGYHHDYLAKSGLFAAFASHRMAVILPAAVDELPDGLRCGLHFLALPTLPEPPGLSGKLSQVAARLHEWYQGHDLKSTASSYAEQIFILSGQRGAAVAG